MGGTNINNPLNSIGNANILVILLSLFFLNREDEFDSKKKMFTIFKHGSVKFVGLEEES